jgi:hypothetical protein
MNEFALANFMLVPMLLLSIAMNWVDMELVMIRAWMQ